MRVVICAPIAPDNTRRKEIWSWVRHEWLERHHPEWPIFEAFMLGAGNARNQAAKFAGDWDVAVFHDADTIVDPVALRRAVGIAASSTRLVIACETHMYMSKGSSDRITAGGPFFPHPYRGDRPSIHRAIVHHPCSGVLAMSRKLWDRVGGYIELFGADGCEDQAMIEMARIFGDGISHVEDFSAFHFWHEPGPDRYLDPPPNLARNEQIWQHLARIARHGSSTPLARKQAAAYLATLGHKCGS